MYLEIVTTITSKIPLDDGGIGSPTHAVNIDAEGAAGLPVDAIYAVVLGGLGATKASVLEECPRLTDPTDEEN